MRDGKKLMALITMFIVATARGIASLILGKRLYGKCLCHCPAVAVAIVSTRNAIGREAWFPCDWATTWISRDVGPTHGRAVKWI